MIDWLFRNRVTGEITVIQRPNLVFAVFVIASGLAWMLPPHHRPHEAAALVATVALVGWAVDELVRGVNPWRRFLGAGALVYEATRLYAR